MSEEPVVLAMVDRDPGGVVATEPVSQGDGVLVGSVEIPRLPGTFASTEVGVDAWDTAPVTIEEIKARLAEQPDVEDEERYEPPSPTRHTPGS